MRIDSQKTGRASSAPTPLGWLVVLLLGILAPLLPAWHAALEHGGDLPPHGACRTAFSHGAGVEDDQHSPADAEPSRVAAGDKSSHDQPSGPARHSPDDCVTCWELSLAKSASLTVPAALVCVGAVRDETLPPVPEPMVRRIALPVGSVRGPPLG